MKLTVSFVLFLTLALEYFVRHVTDRPFCRSKSIDHGRDEPRVEWTRKLKILWSASALVCFFLLIRYGPLFLHNP